MTSEEYQTQKAALLSETERAFEGIERDEAIVELISSLRIIDAQDKKVLLESGARWQDVPDNWLQEDRSSLLIYLDAHSFRYYLPAYLSCYLRLMDAPNRFSSFPFRLVSFVLNVGKSSPEFYLEKFTALNLEQSQVIARFLVLLCQRCVFLYEQEEAGSTVEAYIGSGGYKNQYQLFQWTLQQHWQQFLGSGFTLREFPYSAERRRWREMWRVPDQRKRKRYEAKKAALIAEIEQAFDGVERGSGTTLHESSVIDNYGSPEERAAARELDTETRWQDVPSEHIQTTNPIFLDEQGFHYYCPAFLIGSLHNFDSQEEGKYSDSFSQLDFLLEPSSESGVPSFDARFGLFNMRQKTAIAHYLQFKPEQWDFYLERSNFSSDPEEDVFDYQRQNLQRTMDGYWSQFL